MGPEILVTFSGQVQDDQHSSSTYWAFLDYPILTFARLRCWGVKMGKLTEATPKKHAFWQSKYGRLRHPGTKFSVKGGKHAQIVDTMLMHTSYICAANISKPSFMTRFTSDLPVIYQWFRSDLGVIYQCPRQIWRSSRILNFRDLQKLLSRRARCELLFRGASGWGLGWCTSRSRWTLKHPFNQPNQDYTRIISGLYQDYTRIISGSLQINCWICSGLCRC